MKGFIEVTNKSGKHLLNIKHIEEVWEDKTGKCMIILAFNSPGAVEPDCVTPVETYDEVKRKIEEATK